ncbi:DNA primase [Candidatus Vampirococcus lugosii]|uniref:DNA primase n=1 Tax=Candidatus Vampirococcus lugosii TaxID=2789015 RepID=A0ABS5QPW0_9BACT|nr:DNA primase [Candidatus Vampirococcus lugosii]
MSNLVEDILDNIDIVDVVGRYVDLKKSGANFTGLCPFHNEKTPSFVVSPDKQMFKCFGCGQGGNAIKFVMEIEKADFLDSAKILCDMLNLDINNYLYKNGNDNKNDNGINQKEKIKLINKKALNFFKTSFENNIDIKKYVINDRKLEQKIIDDFDIGFAPNNYYDLINYLKDKGFDSQDIIDSSLAKKSQTGEIYSFFRNRMMFSIYDHMGNLVAFAGRVVDNNDSPKYLNVSETKAYDKSKVLYGLNIAKQNIKFHNKIIVVEGYMDVIALYRAGFAIGVAPCGTALTSYQIKLLKRITDNVVFSFDSDDAGIQATYRGLKISWSMDVFPKILIIPDKYKDIDEYINSNDEINFDEIDGFTYILNKLTLGVDLKSPVERRQLNEKVFDLLSNVNDFSILTYYLEIYSNLLGINYDILFSQFKTYLKTKRTYTKSNLDQKKLNYEDKYVVGALFYQDFIKKNTDNSEKLNKYVDLFVNMNYILNDYFISLLIDNKIDGEEKEKILEYQMRWERQFDQVKTEKKDAILINFFKNQIHKLSKKILKSGNLNDKEKQDFVKKISSLEK